MEIGAKQLGAGCPTGPAMPPGRWLGLGGTGASSHASDLQFVLPVYRERHGSRGPFSGSISASVPDAGKLSIGTRRICNLDDQRNQKPADRSLPANQTRPDHRFAGRCDAGGGEQRVVWKAPRRAGAAGRVERAGADGADEAFSGVTRGGYFAGPAAIGVRRNTAKPGGAGGYSKIPYQPRTYRIGKDFAANGSGAIMSARRLVMAGVEENIGSRQLVGGWL